MAIVRMNSDQVKNARMTAEQQKRFDAIREEEIDYSDIPAPTEQTVWIRPETLDIAVEVKQQITVRLDTDVVQFFKGTGKRYQTRINAVLREYMLAQRKHTESRPGTPGM